jgi:hypothetical protein
VEFRSQLETERADRDEIQGELFELKQKSEKSFLAAQKFQFPEAVEKKEWTELTTLAQQVGAREKNQKNFLAEPKIEFSEVATILSQLLARRKKSPVSLADLEEILEMIEES